jgi:hypothetical protein
MRKIKRLIASTNESDELDRFRRKEMEYQIALEELKQKEHKEEEEEEEQESFVVHHDGQGSSGSIQIEDLMGEMTSDEKTRYKTLQKKLEKANKLLSKAREEGDRKQAKKLEAKLEEYQTAVDDMKKR